MAGSDCATRVFSDAMLPFLSNIAALLGLVDRASTAVTKAGRFRKDWHDARQADKKAAAAWLGKVADCLMSLRSAVKLGRSPAAATSKLNAYASAVPGTVESLLKKQRVQALQRRLRALHRSAGGVKDLTPAQRKTVVENLEAAAAECQALADFAEAS